MQTHFNTEGNPLGRVQKSLISGLSATLESKNLTIDERNLTSTQWVEYNNGTKRTLYNSLPDSSITAEAVSVNAFALSQADNAGVITTSTSPLVIQKDGTWYTYGWDLTKNICELYGSNGYIRTAYTYSPYGSVTESGNTRQPIQWSSEYHDTELGLVYYNYRHYNPLDGRWLGRDPKKDMLMYHLFRYLNNGPIKNMDFLGKDRAIITFNKENKYIHSTLRIDNWIIVDGKYQRDGYIDYNFGPAYDISTVGTIAGSILNVCLVCVCAVGELHKTHTYNYIEGIAYKKTTPCEDLAYIEELDRELNKFKIYNVILRNCHHWVNWCYIMDNDKDMKCCNPDGTPFEE